MIVVSGPPANKQALIEQARVEYPEEASTEGILFVPEDLLGGDEEERTATLLAIHREASAKRRTMRRSTDPLAQERRDAWRRAGL